MQQSTAVLKQDRKKLYEFIITRNRHAPFVDLTLSIDIKTNQTKKGYLLEFILDKCKDLHKNLLSDIRSQIDSRYQSFHLLLKDANFKKAIAEMDKNIKIKAQI